MTEDIKKEEVKEEPKETEVEEEVSENSEMKKIESTDVSWSQNDQ